MRGNISILNEWERIRRYCKKYIPAIFPPDFTVAISPENLDRVVMVVVK